MDYKGEAIQKLKGLEGARSACACIREELLRIDSRLTGIRSATADGSPVQGGGNGREDALLNLLTSREELLRRQRENELWISQVERALGCLEDEERIILDRLYVNRQRQSVDRLCRELNLEKSTVYRRRDLALRDFTRSLYGFESA